MSVQQSQEGVLQLIQLNLDQLSELISKLINVENQKLLVQLQKTIDNSVNKNKTYSRKEAAKKLSVSLTTLHNWKERGILVPMQSGRKCLYTAAQLEAFLRGQSDDLP